MTQPNYGFIGAYVTPAEAASYGGVVSTESYLYDVAEGRIEPIFPPSAPTGLAVSPGNERLSLAWTAPAATGGTSISGYTVEYTPSGGATTTVDTGSNAPSYELTGLVNGTNYSVRVRAVNAAGAGDYSAAASATPTGAGVFTALGLPTPVQYTRRWSGLFTSTATLTRDNPTSTGGDTYVDFSLSAPAYVLWQGNPVNPSPQSGGINVWSRNPWPGTYLGKDGWYGPVTCFLESRYRASVSYLPVAGDYRLGVGAQNSHPSTLEGSFTILNQPVISDFRALQGSLGRPYWTQPSGQQVVYTQVGPREVRFTLPQASTLTIQRGGSPNYTAYLSSRDSAIPGATLDKWGYALAFPSSPTAASASVALPPGEYTYGLIPDGQTATFSIS